MGEFLVDLWGLMKERKKFWLLTNYCVFSDAWWVGGIYIWLSGGAVHLYFVLD